MKIIYTIAALCYFVATFFCDPSKQFYYSVYGFFCTILARLESK